MKYSINTDSATEALQQLLAAFKQDNPSVGRFQALASDGSKATLVIAQPKKRAL